MADFVVMALSGQRKQVLNGRLSDCISIGVLTTAFPPQLVDQVIEETGKREQRVRKLPARVTVYFVLALCLFSRESYVEVAALLVKGLVWAKAWTRPWAEPSDTALVNARRRLGPEPLEALYRQVAKPLATPGTQGAWYRHWRLVAIDGMTLDVPDTPQNAEQFGRPATNVDGLAAFPQARVVGLVECGTHAIFDAAIGPCTTAEATLAPTLFTWLTKDMLALSDRGFWSYQMWTAASSTGAELLWRVRSDVILPVLEVFDDSSYLSQITDRKERDPIIVRVIEYRLDGRSNEIYRLVTTILDQEAPAIELAALYAGLWGVQSAFGEWKAHRRGANVMVRSKSPDGVRQEIWGHLLVHYAIRSLMLHATHEAEPDRMSFLNCLRIVRRRTTRPAAFPS